MARALERAVGFRVVVANASLAAHRSHEAIEEEGRRILAEAKAVDAEEDTRFGPDQRGDELPAGLGRRAERLKQLQEAKRRLEGEAAEAARAAQEKLAERAAEETATGKKKRGRKPRAVEPTPSEEAKANTTDPDSRIMKSRQGYHVQAVVSEDQIVVAIEVTQEANDVRQLLPMLEQTKENLDAVGRAEHPQPWLGDAGYWSEANVLACQKPDLPELWRSGQAPWGWARARWN